MQRGLYKYYRKKILRYITFVISKYQMSNTVNNIIYLTFCQLITFSISNSQAWLSYIANWQYTCFKLMINLSSTNKQHIQIFLQVSVWYMVYMYVQRKTCEVFLYNSRYELSQVNERLVVLLTYQFILKYPSHFSWFLIVTSRSCLLQYCFEISSFCLQYFIILVIAQVRVCVKTAISLILLKKLYKFSFVV